MQLFVAAAVAWPLVVVVSVAELLLQLLAVVVEQLTVVVESTAFVVEIVVAAGAESLSLVEAVGSSSVICLLLFHQVLEEPLDQVAEVAHLDLFYLTAYSAGLPWYLLAVP